MGLALHPQHHEEMRVKGFTIFPSVFSTAEMAELDKSLDNLASREGKSRDGAVVFMQRVAERCQDVKSFARRAELVAIATAFLGPDVDLYFYQHVVKNPGPQEAFSWHQDDAYGPVEPTPYLTVWVSMTESTTANGCVWALPGSWHHGLLNHERSSFGLSCHSLDDPDQGVPIVASAGDIACFWSLTVHKSGPNLTNTPRKAMILQYCRPGLRHKSTGMLISSRIPIARGGQRYEEV